MSTPTPHGQPLSAAPAASVDDHHTVDVASLSSERRAWAEVAALTARLEAVERQLADARAATAAPASGDDGSATPSPVTRRRVLALAGAAVAGGAASMAANGGAAATDGLAIVNGDITTAARTTGLYTVNSGNPPDTAGDLLTTAGSGLLFISHTAVSDGIGVSSFGNGTGVLGVSLNGFGVEARSTNATAMYASSGSGVAVYGLSTSSDGVIGASDAETNGVGVRGQAVGDDSSSAVYAQANDTATGIRSVAQGGLGLDVTSEEGDGALIYGQLGVNAFAPTNGTATAANPHAPGGGVVAHGTYGLIGAQGTKAHLLLCPNNVSLFGSTPKTAPLSRVDSHQRGEIDTDASGDLWYCVTSGTPGSWRRLAGTATAGSLVLLTSPTRVYDSRPGQAPVAIGPKTALTPGTRTINCTLNSSGVPANAAGVLVGVTVLWGSGSGFVAATPGGTGFSGTSNTNSNGVGSKTSFVATVRAGLGATLDLTAGGSAIADVIVDVTGYYL